jgi:hypothetical protein
MSETAEGRRRAGVGLLLLALLLALGTGFLLWRGCQAPPPAEGTEGAAGVTAAGAGDAPARRGTLQVRFCDVPGGEPQRASYAIHAAGDRETPVAADHRVAASVELPAGTYDLYCERDATQKWVTGLVVRPGEVTERTVALGNGTLRLSFVQDEDGPPVAVSYTVFVSGDPAASRASDHGEAATLELPDGAYDIHCEWRVGERTVTGVRVVAGEEARRRIVFDLGRLRVAATKAGQPFGISYELYPAGALEERLAADHGHEETFLLPPGAYDLRYAWDGGEGWLRGMRVEAGRTTEKEIAVDAEAAGGPAAAAFVVVLPGGRRVRIRPRLERAAALGFDVGAADFERRVREALERHLQRRADGEAVHLPGLIVFTLRARDETGADRPPHRVRLEQVARLEALAPEE